MSDINWEEKCKELALLLVECRDALPAISITNAKIYSIDLNLADRIDDALEPWVTTDDDPDGI